MAYARRLTREDLERAGITNITEDGRVFRQGLEIPLNITPTGYRTLWIYDTDKDGNYIKYNFTSTGHYYYRQRMIGLHRAMWAWHHGEVPQGYVVDHINNSHENLEDYYLSNLQLLTPAQNTAKEKKNWHKTEIPCMLSKPRSFYENKLNHYLAEYEKAKEAGDATLTHRLRSNVSQTRARLRYYDSHKADAEALCKAQEEDASKREYRHSRAAQIKRFKYELRILHDRYTEAKTTYGPDHEITQAAKAKWKRGIRISNKWIESHPAIKKEKKND